MKCKIGLHNDTLACSEQNSLSGYCQVSYRLPTMAFCDVQSSLKGFPRNRSNASLTTKDHSRDLELPYPLSKFSPNKGGHHCVN